MDETSARAADRDAAAGPAVDWAAVRAAYEAGGESLAALRRRFGISDWHLRDRRQRENWPVRPADPRLLARLRQEQAAQRRAAEEAAARWRIDWPDIRAAFEAGGEAIYDICRRFGVSVEEFRRRRDREGWLRQGPRPSGWRPAPGVDEIQARLRRILARQAAELEARLAAAPATEADLRMAEIQARALRQLAGPAAGGAAKRREAPRPMGEEDVEWMREQLKQRLRQLQASASRAWFGAAAGADEGEGTVAEDREQAGAEPAQAG